MKKPTGGLKTRGLDSSLSLWEITLDSLEER